MGWVNDKYEPDMPFEGLKGKTLQSVTLSDDKENIEFTTVDREKYSLYHSQDCCESVSVEDICGELSDLVGSPILLAEESTNDKEDPEDLKEKYKSDYRESFTWTFYRLATVRGAVTIRWYGTSNGYYGEGVSFSKIS